MLLLGGTPLLDTEIEKIDQRHHHVLVRNTSQLLYISDLGTWEISACYSSLELGNTLQHADP